MKPHLWLTAAGLAVAAASSIAAAQTITTFVDQFDRNAGPSYELLGPNWQVATWKNGWPFACTFATKNVALVSSGNIWEKVAGQLNLSFDTNGSVNDATCAEARTQNSFQYGTFYVSMRPSMVSGSVSSYFLYTGRSRTRSHFEIDIEFVPGSQIPNATVLPDSVATGGRPPAWHLYTNYWVNGKENPVWIDLERFIEPATGQPLRINPFAEKREYSYIWTRNSISWWINAGTSEAKRWVMLRRAAVSITAKMPLMMNVWTGAEGNGWTGPFDSTNRTGMAQYDHVVITLPKAAP